MTPAIWGAVLGAAFAGGLLLVVSRVLALRRPRLETRVLPYIRDLPQVAAARPVARRPPPPPGSSARCSARPPTRSSACSAARLGTAPAPARRPRHVTVPEFRVQQVIWGLVAFALAAAYSLLKALTHPGGAVPAVLLCLTAFVVGVLARDHHLTSQVKARERRILAEFPTVAELLALAVAAGESPVAALDRVVRRSGGELSADLARVLADVRTGEPVASAFDRMAATHRTAAGRALRPGRSPSRSSAAPRSPTSCTPRPPTSATPAAAS